MDREASREILDADRVRFVVHLAREVVERVDRHALVMAERDEAPVEVSGLSPGHVAIEAFRAMPVRTRHGPGEQGALQVDHLSEPAGSKGL